MRISGDASAPSSGRSFASTAATDPSSSRPRSSPLSSWSSHCSWSSWSRSATAATLEQWHLLLYMLGIPVLTPAILAAYAVAGERQQGSLEPVLTTPIRREEFLLAKALAALVPSVLIASYACMRSSSPASCNSHSPPSRLRSFGSLTVVAQLLLTPLLAGWSIWVGIAISTRSNDVRVAQQLSLLADLPVLLVTSLIAFNAIHLTPAPRGRPRGGIARCRHPRLVDRLPDVQPRAAHHRHGVTATASSGPTSALIWPFMARNAESQDPTDRATFGDAVYARCPHTGQGDQWAGDPRARRCRIRRVEAGLEWDDRPAPGRDRALHESQPRGRGGRLHRRRRSPRSRSGPAGTTSPATRRAMAAWSSISPR